mmetsp:Transcript_28719/g.67532  ORF Transcript_28719/g.67532 Transcript_28719/m.67532 type:complete len:515 (-) Transcript_28719:263-1807(-)
MEVDAPVPEEHVQLEVPALAPDVVGDSSAVHTTDAQASKTKRRSDKLVAFVANFTLTRAEMLRATPAHRVLSWLGMALHEGPFGADWYRYSAQTTEISQFWSHSWHGNKWFKIILLYLVCNGAPALVFGTLAVLVATVPLVWSGVTDNYWVHMVGLLTSTLVLLMWRPSKKVFVDKLCISQHDAKLQSEGVVNVGATVKNSKSMLACWDSTYLERLWCILEVAAFIKTHEESKLIIRPTAWAPAAVFLFLTNWILEAMSNILRSWVVDDSQWTTLGSYEYLEAHVRSTASKAIIFVPLTIVVVHYWRVHTRALETASRKLLSFRFDQDIRCHCCTINHIHPVTGRAMTCDHNTIRECLCLWFGSVQQFEEIMRDRVFHVFKGSSGRQSIPYLWILATRVPNLWSGIWLAVQTAYWSDIATTAAMTFLLLGTWLVTVPLWLRVLLQMAYKLRHKRDSWWKEFLIDLALALCQLLFEIVYNAADTLLVFLLEDVWAASYILLLVLVLLAIVVFWRC